MQVISELVEQCGVSDIKEDKLFSTLRSMGDTIAVCDKLLRYPLPLAWSRHTSRCDQARQLQPVLYASSTSAATLCRLLATGRRRNMRRAVVQYGNIHWLLSQFPPPQ